MPSLADDLRAYLRRPPAQADLSLARFLAQRDPWVLAHHPPGEASQAHVWTLGGLHICRGCLMAWIGSALALGVHGALLLALGNWWRKFTPWEVGAGLALLLVPTVVTAFVKRPAVLKHGARVLLGAVVISAGFYAACAPWTGPGLLARGIMLAVYLGVRLPLERKRSRENAALGRKA